MFCEQCGAEVPNGALFCQNCGALVKRPNGEVEQRHSQPQAQGQIYSQQAVGRNNKWKIIAIIAIVCCLVAVCAGGYMAYRSKKDATVAQQQQETKQQETKQKEKETEKAESSEEIPEKQEPAVEEVKLTAKTVSCLGGNCSISLQSYSSQDNSITLRYTNKIGQEISFAGLPLQIIGGESKEIDYYSNMNIPSTTIASGTYSDVRIVVDPAFFDKGGALSGKMFTMDPSVVSDNEYRIDIVKQ